ncbi:archaeosortase A [Halostagnicola kamekurae]|uniref:Archaeosortase A, PGF-CTERM-specific n=1 Tax=Halostagnicola kamekurae TaxID=619731 RepID=A0A1I6RVR7_9EURY|nr:archaeosortase A [Halostagnicola kamekurae]SFS68807.1 archaeosortase A, PGF-CTERM-specific [Halostagnicola kamekurae]
MSSLPATGSLSAGALDPSGSLAAGTPAAITSPITELAQTTVVGSFTVVNLLAWVSIGIFVLAFALEWLGEIDPARYVAAGAWVLFGLFWLLMAPHYYADVQSPLQTLLSLAALPLCTYAAYLLVNGRASLLVLSKAVAIMGIIYLPAETIPFVRRWLIETTAAQTHYGMELLGHSPGLIEGSAGYESKFGFDPDETVTGRTTYIIMACTGIGSMAIFGGLIGAVKAPLKRKVAAFAVAIGVIWFLNLIRNVFIGLASPWGWFQHDPIVHVMTTYLGTQPDRVSYLVAHNYISQLGSVIALLGIAYLLMKILPEILEPLEEVLFIISGTEYDLEEAIDAEKPADADD